MELTGSKGRCEPSAPAINLSVCQDANEAVVSIALPGLSTKRLEAVVYRLKRVSRLTHAFLAPLVSHEYNRTTSLLTLRYFVGGAVQLSQLIDRQRDAASNSHNKLLAEATVISVLFHASSCLGFACSQIRTSLANCAPCHHSALSPEFVFVDLSTKTTLVVALGIAEIFSDAEAASTSGHPDVNMEKEDVYSLGLIADSIITSSNNSFSALLKRIIGLMISSSPAKRPQFVDLATFFASMIQLQQSPKMINCSRHTKDGAVAKALPIPPPAKTLARTSSQIPNYQRSPSPQSQGESVRLPKTTIVTRRPSRSSSTGTDGVPRTTSPKSFNSMITKLTHTLPSRGSLHIKHHPSSVIDQSKQDTALCPQRITSNHSANPLLRAVENNDVSEVKRLKDMLSGSTDDEGNTALIRAIQLRRAEIALELLPLEYERRNNRGQTALMVSIAAKLDAVSAELLLNYSSLYGAADEEGNTALMYAVLSNTKRDVEALTLHEYGIPNKQGKYPIHIAIEQRHIDIALYLLDYNTSVLDKEYRTIAEYCDLYKCQVVKDRLCTIEKEASGMFSNYSALMVAAGLNNIDDLYRYIPTQMGLRHVSGDTALIIAIRKNQLEAMRILLPYEFHLPDKHGHFFIYQAVATGSRQTIECVLDYLSSDIMMICLQFDDELADIVTELRNMMEDALADNDIEALKGYAIDLDSVIGHQVETGAVSIYYEILQSTPSTPILLPDSAIHLGETKLDIHALDMSGAQSNGEVYPSPPSHIPASPTARQSPGASAVRLGTEVYASGQRPPTKVHTPTRHSPTRVNTKLSPWPVTESSVLHSQEQSRTTSQDGSSHGIPKMKTLFHASSSGFNELSESLNLSSEPYTSDGIDLYGNTPLISAVLSGDLAAVKREVKTHAGNMNNKGETALHTAIQLPESDVSASIIEILAPFEWNVQSADGVYPMDMAKSMDHSATVKLLHKYASRKASSPAPLSMVTKAKKNRNLVS